MLPDVIYVLQYWFIRFLSVDPLCDMYVILKVILRIHVLNEWINVHMPLCSFVDLFFWKCVTFTQAGDSFKIN